MRKLGIGLLIILFAISLFGQTGNKEFRATWSITWHQFWSGGSVDELKARTRQILDDHKKANMNAVLWHVRQGGTVYYKSDIEPWGSYLGYEDPGYDPLAYAIEEAHKRGMELHAWFNTFATSSTHSGTPSVEHPEWVCRDQSGSAMTSSRALSPGLEAVREYTVDLAMEIVNNYDIDGIHFDYVRWNEYSSASSSIVLAKKAENLGSQMLDGMWTEQEIETLKASYESTIGSRYLYDVNHTYSSGVPSGYSSWENWWRSSTDEFISVLHDSVQAVKPWVKVSVAALGRYKGGGWNGYYTVYQNSAKWFNEGWVDLMTPMHYHWTDADGFYYELKSDWEPNISQAISDGRIYSVGPGSYNFGSNWNNHPSIVAKVRTISWVDGEHFFSYGSWKDHQYWEEAGETFYSKNTKQKPATFLHSATPDAPTMSLTKIDSFNYEIEITPAGSVTKNQWFIIYRSETNSISKDGSDIVRIYFDDSAFKDTMTFDGYQNYNGQYYYAATMCDRYWNESALTSLRSTNIIPSYSPDLLSQYPADGDTVEINESINLEFSKKMDKSSVENNITITPTPPTMSFTWEHNNWVHGNKKVTIKFNEFLPRSTDYTVTLEGEIQDDIGLSFDGNSDGTGGDSLTFTFTTADIDVKGPVALNVYPDSSLADFDVENVLTIVFDELVDKTTIDTNNITLLNDGTPVNIDPVLFTFGEQSILTLNTYYQLTADADIQLTLDTAITDMAGNALNNPLTYNFHTANEYYDEDNLVDNFTIASTNDWQDPEYSGSTAGTVGASTTFGISSSVYLPGCDNTKSGRITYKWDESFTGDHLLREYCKTSPKSDTTYTIQAYVYGDGSGNKFRFSCYEFDKDDNYTSDIIEVSKWTTIDWKGWKLLEWKLSDPNSVGVWAGLGNQVMDGAKYRLESFQLTKTEDGAVSGSVYVDDLRLINKTPGVAPTKTNNEIIPTEFTIDQNYPNPFNPITNFKFNIVKADNVSIVIYNIRGQKVDVVLNKHLNAGSYNITYDASHLASGIYVYSIKTDGKQKVKRMTLLK